MKLNKQQEILQFIQNKLAAEAKLKTKNNTEYTEFCTLITIIELNNKIKENT